MAPLLCTEPGSHKQYWLQNFQGPGPNKNAAAAKPLQSCLTVRPHRRQPTRLPRPWFSPGKNTGVGCHFLLQCMEVKSEREGAQSCPTLCDPIDCNMPGFPITNSQSLLKLMSKKTTQLFKNLDYFFMLNNENLKTVTIGHEAKYGGPSECGVL